MTFVHLTRTARSPAVCNGATPRDRCGDRYEDRQSHVPYDGDHRVSEERGKPRGVTVSELCIRNLLRSCERRLLSGEVSVISPTSSTYSPDRKNGISNSLYFPYHRTCLNKI